jgi:hypothetical protein
LCSLRRLSVSPGIVAAGRDAQHTAHRGDREFGLVRTHELEDGIEPVYRANDGRSRTRPRLLPVYRVPAAGGGSPCGDDPIPRARPSARIGAGTLVEIGLFDPVADGLSGGLERCGKFRDRTTNSGEFDDREGKLRGVRWACSWHVDLLFFHKWKIVH